MKWTKEKFDLFCAMKEEGCSIEEICNALGCERQAVYDKVKQLKKLNGGALPKYKGKGNDMNCYAKKEKIDPVEFWSMLDAGKSVKEIADHFGVSLKTVYNRITKGRPKGEKIGNVAVKTDDELFDKIIDSIDAGKRDKVDVKTETVDTPTETVDAPTETVDTPTETVIETTKEGDSDMDKSGISGLYRNTKGAREHIECSPTETAEVSSVGTDVLGGPYVDTPTEAEKPVPDIIKLAYTAYGMALNTGFEPTHIVLDVSEARNVIIATGEDALGKVCQLEFSATDPKKMYPRKETSDLK